MPQVRNSIIVSITPCLSASILCGLHAPAILLATHQVSVSILTTNRLKIAIMHKNNHANNNNIFHMIIMAASVIIHKHVIFNTIMAMINVCVFNGTIVLMNSYIYNCYTHKT